jgi:hypothetical protein
VAPPKGEAYGLLPGGVAHTPGSGPAHFCAPRPGLLARGLGCNGGRGSLTAISVQCLDAQQVGLHGLFPATWAPLPAGGWLSSLQNVNLTPSLSGLWFPDCTLRIF